MTQPQHTHLPLTKKKSLKPVDEEFDYAIYDNKNEIIAEVFGRTSKENRPNAEASADFILLACNNHYKLIEALGQLNSLLNGVYDLGTLHDQIRLAQLNVDNLLKQAKGEE